MEDKGAVKSSPPLSHVNGHKPKLADGIELIGEYQGSGFKEPPYLARRADGQVLQLPKLLYLIAENVDGNSDYGEIANSVSDRFGKNVSADNVRYLVDSKLRPLGVLAGPDGRSPKVEKPNPLLALNFRASVIPGGVVNTITSVFRPLFWPLVMAAAIVAFIALDVWLFFMHGVAQGIRSLLNEPIFFLLIFVLVVASAAFHECGHATGCRYGGAKPGVMGVGLYMVWPAFYTDVTDAYRLGKGGRLRTDLGGVYFNALFMIASVGLYALTRIEVLIVVILFLQVEMLHQFLPFLRLDGYYVIADLTGVPDIFSRIRPVLLGLIPGRKPDKRVTELKTWVRVVVTGWVVFAVAFIVYAYGMMLLHLPTVLATAWKSFSSLAGHTGGAFQHGEIPQALFGSVQLLLLALPLVGLAYTLVRLIQRIVRGTWNKTKGKPLQRSLAFAGMIFAGLLLVLAWTPPRATYQPIQPGERGTIGQSFQNAGAVLPAMAAPLSNRVNPVASPSPLASPIPSSAPSSAASATPAASPSSAVVTPSSTAAAP